MRRCRARPNVSARRDRSLERTSRIGERFDGIVTGAAAKGTWVHIYRPAAEGRVVRGHEGLEVGQHVRVELVDTDVSRGFIDFAAVR